MEQPVYSSKQVICFFFPVWKKIGIENLSCLLDNEGNTLMTFSTFMQKYNVNTTGMENYAKAGMSSNVN